MIRHHKIIKNNSVGFCTAPILKPTSDVLINLEAINTFYYYKASNDPLIKDIILTIKHEVLHKVLYESGETKHPEALINKLNVKI